MRSRTTLDARPVPLADNIRKLLLVGRLVKFSTVGPGSANVLISKCHSFVVCDAFNVEMYSVTDSGARHPSHQAPWRFEPAVTLLLWPTVPSVVRYRQASVSRPRFDRIWQA